MSSSHETAILAGGCFWGMQDLLRRYPGVISTRVGYSGGDVPNATYRNHGSHAEAIEIVFDPQKLSYRPSCWSSSFSDSRSNHIESARKRPWNQLSLFGDLLYHRRAETCRRRHNRRR